MGQTDCSINSQSHHSPQLTLVTMSEGPHPPHCPQKMTSLPTTLRTSNPPACFQTLASPLLPPLQERSCPSLVPRPFFLQRLGACPVLLSGEPYSSVMSDSFSLPWIISLDVETCSDFCHLKTTTTTASATSFFWFLCTSVATILFFHSQTFQKGGFHSGSPFLPFSFLLLPTTD